MSDATAPPSHASPTPSPSVSLWSLFETPGQLSIGSASESPSFVHTPATVIRACAMEGGSWNAAHSPPDIVLFEPLSTAYIRAEALPACPSPRLCPYSWIHKTAS